MNKAKGKMKKKSWKNEDTNKPCKASMMHCDGSFGAR